VHLIDIKKDGETGKLQGWGRESVRFLSATYVLNGSGLNPGHNPSNDSTIGSLPTIFTSLLDKTEMAKTLSLALCLLTSLIIAGVPAQAIGATEYPTPAIAQQGIGQMLLQIAAEQSVSAPTLTLDDLPPGFTALPPEIASAIASRLDSLRQQVAQVDLKPENFFAFVNQQNFQVVLGFTGKLPNEQEQANFDASLQKLQQPEAQQQAIALLQEKLKKIRGMKVTEYRPLPEANNLANASTGLALDMEMQGQPLRLDFAAFRRNGTGAFAAVMYAKSGKSAISVGDVAQKLDNRIVKLSAQANRPPLISVR